MNESLAKQNGVIYQIHVREQLDEDAAQWFEEFSCAPMNGGTVLWGEIADQAALRGVLDKIFALGLTLTALSVRANSANQNLPR